MLECPLYNSIRERFASQFQNVELGSLKFYHFDHHVHINHCLSSSMKLAFIVQLDVLLVL